MTQTSPSKTCSKCLRVLSEDDFYRRGGKGGGKQYGRSHHRAGQFVSSCKECVKEAKRKWAHQNKAHCTRYAKARYDKYRSAISDEYLKMILSNTGNNRGYTPRHMLTPELIELKRLELALLKYAKEHK